jgi:hypothetical protein
MAETYTTQVETDPLLPHSETSPEIQDADGRRQGVSTYGLEPKSPRSQLMSLLWTAFATIIAIFIFLSAIFPGVIHGHIPGKPKDFTIEERVNGILNSTPLIGTYSLLLENSLILVYVIIASSTIFE